MNDPAHASAACTVPHDTLARARRYQQTLDGMAWVDAGANPTTEAAAVGG
jgi:hypothetical protein